MNEIEQAKQLLKSQGYYVDSLWCVEDVQLNFDCSEQQAQKVLDKVFNSESVTEYIFDAIKLIAKDLNLKHADL